MVTTEAKRADKDETAGEEALGKERLNKLSRGKWLKYSVSVWNDVKYESYERTTRKKHPAMFPLEIPKRLIETFTNEGDWVLDPFSGTGTTLLACKMLARNGYGFDISSEFTNIAIERVAKQIAVEASPTRQIPVCDDSRNLLKYVEKDSIDFAVTSPPYWKILREEKTFLKREATPYTEHKEDLGNIQSYEEFLAALVDVFSKVYQSLRMNKFLVVDIMDVRINDTFYPMHADLIHEMSKIKFGLWDIIIWDRHMEYNSLTAMIYPYKFYVNKVHEYLLIFQKKVEEQTERETKIQSYGALGSRSTTQALLIKGPPFSRTECLYCKEKGQFFCQEKCSDNIWRKSPARK